MSSESSWPDDATVLASCGWEMECQSPLEISCTEMGTRVGFASGIAAQVVIDAFRRKMRRKYRRENHES